MWMSPEASVGHAEVPGPAMEGRRGGGLGGHGGWQGGPYGRALTPHPCRLGPAALESWEIFQEYWLSQEILESLGNPGIRAFRGNPGKLGDPRRDNPLRQNADAFNFVFSHLGFRTTWW